VRYTRESLAFAGLRGVRVEVSLGLLGDGLEVCGVGGHGGYICCLWRKV